MRSSQELLRGILEKVRAEYDSFMEELRNKPVGEVILRAYEIVLKEEIVNFLENDDLSDFRQLNALNGLSYPLSTIYSEWLVQDTSIYEDLRIAIGYITQNYFEKDQKETTKEPIKAIDDDEEMEL